MNGEVDDAKMARVAHDWVAYQGTDLPQYAWAVDEKDIWFYEESDWATMERFVRAVCAVAGSDELHVVGMIGASLLEDLIQAHPERAIAFLEAEVKSNEVLAEALGNVWCDRDQPELRTRIAEIRSRRG
jgi:hypothetical protein